MPITVVQGRGRTAVMDQEGFAHLRSQHDRTIVDLGTGDGRFAYHLAAAGPRHLVVGIDAIDENLAAVAYKASRKPAKGGRPNLMLVRAAVESLPGEFTGVADEVHVLLPWGRLLEGIVLGHDEVVSGVAALCAPGGAVVLTLNAEVWIEGTPRHLADLPRPTAEFIAQSVAPAFARAGVILGPARYLSVAEVGDINSTWAKRLRHGRGHAQFLRVEGARGRE